MARQPSGCGDGGVGTGKSRGSVRGGGRREEKSTFICPERR